MISKTYLRDIVTNNKRLFDQTNNNNYIIRATIAYAVYNASGGAKLIPLPLFTDELYNIVYNIAVVKIKIGNNISTDSINKAESYLVSNIKSVKALEFIGTLNNQSLKLYTTKGVYLIDIGNDISYALARIAYICIMENCAVSMQNAFIQGEIYTFFSNIGRA